MVSDFRHESSCLVTLGYDELPSYDEYRVGGVGYDSILRCLYCTRCGKGKRTSVDDRGILQDEGRFSGKDCSAVYDNIRLNTHTFILIRI